MPSAISTHQLRKVYQAPSGKKRRAATVGYPTAPGAQLPAGDVVALDALDIEICEGEFFGLLGPNGAGQSTTHGILTTRIAPTSGSATVAGADVVTRTTDVKQRIGVVPQRPNPDHSLLVSENLVFHASYFGIGAAEAEQRARTLLEQFGIADKASAKVDQLSGGQQQRLMIARALIHEPDVIFLDEPTVGLDPQARLYLWDVLRELHGQGRTIVMTTHYMEEADRLCERVAIIDKGNLLALDTPSVLRQRAPGGTLLELVLDGDAAAVAAMVAALPGVLRAEARGATLQAYSESGGRVLPSLIDAAESAGRTVKDIHLLQPSLETLFVALTGRKLD